MSNFSSFRAISAGLRKGSSSEQHESLSACSCSFSPVHIYQRIGVYFSFATSLVTSSSEPAHTRNFSSAFRYSLHLNDSLCFRQNSILLANPCSELCNSFGWAHVDIQLPDYMQVVNATSSAKSVTCDCLHKGIYDPVTW